MTEKERIARQIAIYLKDNFQSWMPLPDVIFMEKSEVYEFIGRSGYHGWDGQHWQLN